METTVVAFEVSQYLRELVQRNRDLPPELAVEPRDPRPFDPISRFVTADDEVIECEEISI